MPISGEPILYTDANNSENADYKLGKLSKCFKAHITQFKNQNYKLFSWHY